MNQMLTPRIPRLYPSLSNGKPYLLVASGPRYRCRQPPQMHRCEYCGYEYLRGDPEENLAHRSYHAEVRRIVDPWPKKQFVEALETESDAELVHAHSPKWKHHKIFQRARQFRREMKFDFIQWGKATHQDTDPQVHGFLFNDTSGTFPHGSIVGGVASAAGKIIGSLTEYGYPRRFAAKEYSRLAGKYS